MKMIRGRKNRLDSIKLQTELELQTRTLLLLVLLRTGPLKVHEKCKLRKNVLLMGMGYAG